MDLNREYTYDVELRLKGVLAFVAAFFLVVVLRLFYLQIVKGETYRIFSENNSIRNVVIPAPRGMIYDRNGIVIAGSRPVFDLVVVPQYVTDREKLISTLSGVLNADPEEIRAGLAESSRFPPYRPYTLFSDVGFDVVSRVLAMKSPFENDEFSLDGVDINHRYVRKYSEGDALPHVLGYVSEVDKERLEKLKAKYPGVYRAGDGVGITGLEEMFDRLIRGRDGVEQKIVNAVGREIEYSDVSLDLVHRPAAGGGDIYLTIDLDLQRIARKLMEGRTGSVVAIDPESGAVLAMYSSPGFDLSRLQSAERSAYWMALVKDMQMPLFNRAVKGLYAPASTYKIVTAIAALQEGAVDLSFRVNCRGGLMAGKRFYGCWLGSGHGTVDIIAAIKQSCDTFFYEAGLKLGIDRLAKYARMLGLGKKTGIELAGEAEGLVPGTKWKREARGSEWKMGDTLSASIGQGFDLATPLQVALLGAEVANGGYEIRPHLVEKIISADGDILYKGREKRKKIAGISDESLAIVREGLEKVVGDAGGTAHLLDGYGLKIAGKTGTAQVVSREAAGGKTIHKTHAWFVGYAPYDGAKIAVAAIVEHGGHGSSAAAPIVGEIIRTHLINPTKAKFWLFERDKEDE